MMCPEGLHAGLACNNVENEFPFAIAYPNRLLNAIIVTFGNDGKTNPPSLLSNLLM